MSIADQNEKRILEHEKPEMAEILEDSREPANEGSHKVSKEMTLLIGKGLLWGFLIAVTTNLLANLLEFNFQAGIFYIVWVTVGIFLVWQAINNYVKAQTSKSEKSFADLGVSISHAMVDIEKRKQWSHEAAFEVAEWGKLAADAKLVRTEAPSSNEILGWVAMAEVLTTRTWRAEARMELAQGGAAKIVVDAIDSVDAARREAVVALDVVITATAMHTLWKAEKALKELLVAATLHARSEAISEADGSQPEAMNNVDLVLQNAEEAIKVAQYAGEQGGALKALATLEASPTQAEGLSQESIGVVLAASDLDARWQEAAEAQGMEVLQPNQHG